MMMVCCVPNPVVVVISPLLNLMEDQTNFFTGSGNLDWVDRRIRRQGGQREDRERKMLCSVYFTGHLSLLGNGRCIGGYVVFRHLQEFNRNCCGCSTLY